MKTLLMSLSTLLLTATALVAAPPKAPKPPKVYAAQVSMVPFADEIEALGTLKANEQVSLAATVTEVVTAVHFDDNQRVKKGELLVELDTAEERAELAEERSKLKEAKRQVKRLEPLAAKGAASQSALDASRLEVQTAEARLNAIQARIGLRRITAPFDGVVGLRNISVGSLVKSDTLITTVDDDSVMKLDFTVPSLYLASLRPGLEIVAMSKAFAKREFAGVISAIGSRVDPVTRSVTVRALIDNPDRLLKPGLLMQVEIRANPRETLVLPEACIIARGNENFVLAIVTKEGMTTVERRKVVIGTRQHGRVEVLEGLVAGESVVLEGLMKARPGSPVTVAGPTDKGDRIK